MEWKYSTTSGSILAVEDHQSKLTLMSESPRNDGRIWVPGDVTRSAGQRKSRRPNATNTSNACTGSLAISVHATSPRAAKSV